LGGEEHVHGGSRAGGVGRVLRCLAMEPQISDIHREADGSEQKNAQSDQDE